MGLKPDRVISTDVDETPLKGELPRALAQRLARLKAEAGATAAPEALVLAADTVVACGRRILPKAETETQARDCLTLLSGRAHIVMTAIALATPRGVRERLVETRVKLKRLTAAEIDAYVACREWEGKAGGYGVQGRAGKFVLSLNGSYSAVVGLPLYETAALLESAGVAAFSR